MAKEKVYKLAQEFKVSSEALVQMLRGMGIDVKSHMSTVDENLRNDIKKKFEQERAEIKKEYERKKQMLTKAREDLIGKEEEPSTETAQQVPQVQAPESVQAAEKEVAQMPAETTAPKPQQPVQPIQSGQQTSEAIPAAPVQKTAPQQPSYQPRYQQGQQGQQPQHRQHYQGNRDSQQQRPSRERTFTPFQQSPRPATAPAALQVPVVPDPEKAALAERKEKDKGKKKSKKHNERVEVDEVELKANIKKTLAKIGSGFSKKKYKKEAVAKDESESEERKTLNVSEFVTVNELSNMMTIPVSELITKCLELGLFVTINQRLDFETIELLVDEFGYTAQLMSEYASDVEEPQEENVEVNLVHRSPVVTVMGHVDHGKTSLLDYIRKTNVMSGEAGGITQHIAAYEVKTRHGSVTFLDTPGHEAFTAMRARGSQITDVIVLVVAADSGVMPQTKEAIDHARAANVPLVVALNKIDLPTANPDKVKAELANYNVLVEDYGGTVSCVEISAKKGIGIEKLLEVLALETEILDLKANIEGKATGVVIESELDKGKGPIATILVQKGILKKGDAFVTGMHFGRVRELYNELGKMVECANPSQPVLVLGLSGTPQAGDSFRVVDEEKEAREIAARRRLAQKERELRKISTISLDHLYEQIKAGQVQTLNLIIKGDVDGSVEALAASMEKLSTEEIKVRVIHKSVGAIKETDVMLATASSALIIGFHLSPNSKIREMAKNEGVEIRTYKIIYEALDSVRDAMEGMLKPEIRENITAVITVRRVFKISKIGTVAGSYIESGTLVRGSKVRVIRDDVIVAESRIDSLKRIQEDVREVQTGYECGITLQNFNDIMENDRIEAYEEIEVARKLTTPA
ncbi:MAG TPA: translation initiation factor IF-2 [Chitinispirillaceae bacterium]|nr:translation initiation factor IF-2 [Chitinispirillaceae bacterium]